MANLRACCCGSPGTVCAGSCDFDTSYALSGLYVSLNYVTSYKSGSCEACSDYDGTNVQTEIAYTVTGSQSTSCTLTRSTDENGRCCYKGAGQMRMDWSLDKPETYFCCGAIPKPVCIRSDFHSGRVNSVPFCYSVVCLEGADSPFPNETSVWYHTLWICNFPLSNAGFARLDDEECDTYDCNSVSLDRYRLMARGASYAWYTKYKPLDQIFAPDRIAEPCGNLFRRCAVTVPETCYPDDLAFTQGGPFSLYRIAETPTAPDPCTEYSGAPWANTWSCGGPMGSLGAPEVFNCQSNGEELCDFLNCNSATFAYAANFPTIL